MSVAVRHWALVAANRHIARRSALEAPMQPGVPQQPADRRPGSGRLEARPDLLAIQGGFGVYRALPPGVSAMPARAAMARFPSESPP